MADTENADGVGLAFGDDRPNKITHVQRQADGGEGDDTLVADPEYPEATLNGQGGGDTMSRGVIFYGDRDGVKVSYDGVANDGTPGEGDNVTAA